MKLRPLWWVLLVVVLSCGTALSQAAPQFAADFISRKAGTTTTGRIYLGTEKFRIDLRSANRQGGMIVDLRSRKTWVLLPQQQRYLEVPASDTLSQEIPAILPIDRSTMCLGWTACRKMARETMNGRACERWDLSDFRGTQTVWIDNRLGVYVRTLAIDGSTTELQNIHEGPQPQSRFEIPTGYKKLDLPAKPRP